MLPARPYLHFRETARDGIIGRFSPSPKLRKLGYKTFDFRRGGTPFTPSEWAKRGFPCPSGNPWPVTRTGKPLSVPDCLTLAEDIAKHIAAQTDGDAPKPKARLVRTARPVKAITIENLFADYLMSDMCGRNAAVTRADKKQRLSCVTRYFGKDTPPAKLDEIAIEAMFWSEKETRGHTSAHKQFVYLRGAFRWAQTKSREWRPHVPPLNWGLGLPIPDGRIRIASKDEIAALMRAADDPESIYREIGQSGPDRHPKHGKLLEPSGPMPAVGDVITFAYWTAQRPTDILQARKSEIVDVNGQWRFQSEPSKTGKRYGIKVDIPVLPPLEARLRALLARHLEQGWRARPHLFLTDAQGVPFIRDDARDNRFAGHFRRVRRLAAKICPGIETLNAADFRDTAITGFYLAGADDQGIRAFSTHKSAASIQARHKNYLDINAGFADQAGDAYLAFLTAGTKT